MKTLLLVGCAAAVALICPPASTAAESHDLAALLSRGGLTIHHRSLQPANDADHAGAVQFDARAGDGLAWIAGSDFSAGVIECDLKGRNKPGASFVGLAFHGADANTYEAVYFRPFNFRAADAARRNHAVQYIALPEFGWQKLRETRPEVFEHAVSPAPAPEEWFHARVVIEAKKIRVFVNHADEPCLVVERLVERTGGRVGLWVGNGSDGTFANLRITPQR